MRVFVENRGWVKSVEKISGKFRIHYAVKDDEAKYFDPSGDSKILKRLDSIPSSRLLVTFHFDDGESVEMLPCYDPYIENLTTGV